MQNTQCNIAVLISGGGSNLQSIIDHIQRGHINANIACVISNKADAYGLKRAEQAGIPTHIINHEDYDSRELFEAELTNTLKVYSIKIIVLAGFMRILSNSFTDTYQGSILNIHPSLLPNYTGLHTHQRVLNNGDIEHGCSVHFVTAELDSGPLIIQAKVPVMKTDDPDTLAKRVLEQEHIIYPLAVKWLCEDRLSYENGKIIFDNKPLKKAIEFMYKPELEQQ